MSDRISDSIRKTNGLTHFKRSDKGNKSTNTKNLLTLDTPLQYVKGVGPKLATVFKTRLLHNVKDFIYFIPRSYQDNRRICHLSEIQAGRSSVLIAHILDKQIKSLRGRSKKMYEIIVGNQDEHISCKFFRSPYRGWFNSLMVGAKVEVRGAASIYRNTLEFHHPEIFPFSEDEDPEAQKKNILLPIYSEIEQVSQYKIRKIMQTVFEDLDDSESQLEWLPSWLRDKYHLIDIKTALKGLHFPNQKLIEDYLGVQTEYHKRIIFDEFFELQLYLALRKQGWKRGEAPRIPVNQNDLRELEAKLPFSLTAAQKKVLGHILKDLKSQQPMHRLIQGDVGCGKTIVALMAALACAKANYQTAFMVPTEILAEQHYNKARLFLEPFGIQIKKLTGKMKAKEKKHIESLLQTGECSICIGTQALIQDHIKFHQLGLVIVDEQHRFGSHQRALLKEKGRHPHFVVMTATPIPRTLSLALYGDLEISVIDELPLGRRPVLTKRAFKSQRLEVFNFVKDQVQKGRQAYVVYPLVKESEKLDLKNAVNQYEKLKAYYKSLNWGLLTGRMSPEEKQDIMSQFRNNEIQVLVSTTVIEVGVDVPNATVMVVENAERFGLSQMHQLRGRVGRGSDKSYCIFVLGEKFSKEAKYRVHLMTQSSDGFQIAEKDLELRGPGEFLGSRQSGLPTFKMADLMRDSESLSLAKQAAIDLIDQDPKLEHPQHLLTKLRFQKFSSSVCPG